MTKSYTSIWLLIFITLLLSGCGSCPVKEVIVKKELIRVLPPASLLQPTPKPALPYPLLLTRKAGNGQRRQTER